MIVLQTRSHDALFYLVRLLAFLTCHLWLLSRAILFSLLQVLIKYFAVVFANVALSFILTTMLAVENVFLPISLLTTRLIGTISSSCWVSARSFNDWLLWCRTLQCVWDHDVQFKGTLFVIHFLAVTQAGVHWPIWRIAIALFVTRYRKEARLADLTMGQELVGDLAYHHMLLLVCRNIVQVLVLVLLLFLFAGNLYEVLLIREHSVFFSATINNVFFRAERFLNRIVLRCLRMSVDN